MENVNCENPRGKPVSQQCGPDWGWRGGFRQDAALRMAGSRPIGWFERFLNWSSFPPASTVPSCAAQVVHRQSPFLACTSHRQGSTVRICIRLKQFPTLLLKRAKFGDGSSKRSSKSSGNRKQGEWIADGELSSVRRHRLEDSFEQQCRGGR